MADRVKLFGKVTIKQDDQIVYEDIPNHWVNNGLKGLCSYLCGSVYYTNNSQYFAWTGTDMNNGFKLRVGTNTTTVTTFDLLELVNPVAINPSAVMGNNITQVSAGIWHLVYTASWNAGIIIQTVGEVGLYLAPFDNLGVQWSEINATKTQRLVSRISVADGNFVAFTPDASKTLTIEWKVGVSF
jgi:hypothetical protein